MLSFVRILFHFYTINNKTFQNIRENVSFCSVVWGIFVDNVGADDQFYSK
jgi:hypothetical protein